MAGYISAIPAEVRTDFRKRIGGQPVKRRMHIFPTASGGSAVCDPDHCRECYREANWAEGQTHG